MRSPARLIATAIDTAAPLVPGDNRTAARRRLDGLADICRRYLADPDAPRRGGGGHPHLIVTVDQTTLHAAASRTANHEQAATADGSDRDGSEDATDDRRWCRAGRHAVLDRPDRRQHRRPGRLRQPGDLRHHRPRRRRSPKPAPAAGSSPPPNAAPSSPATATAAAGPGATGPSAWSDAHHLTPVEPAAPPPSPTAPCPAKPTTSSSTKDAGNCTDYPTAATSPTTPPPAAPSAPNPTHPATTDHHPHRE